MAVFLRQLLAFGGYLKPLQGCELRFGQLNYAAKRF